MTSVNDVWLRMRALVEQAALYDLAASLLDPPSRRTGEAPEVDLGPYGRGASEDALIDVVLELQDRAASLREEAERLGASEVQPETGAKKGADGPPSPTSGPAQSTSRRP